MANYEEDFSTLHALLPLEVWSTVFDRMPMNDVLENIGNATIVFRNLLSTRRTEYLFGKVWDLLETTLTSRNADVQNRLSKEVIPETCTACGRTRRHGTYSYSAALSARGACKTWKTSIDAYYLSTQILGHEWKWTAGFTTSSSAAAFLRHFESSHQAQPSNDPFVGGSVKLVLQIEDEQPHVLKMLNVYGRHVMDCRIDGNDEGVDEQCVRQLSGWLKWMPNLFNLQLCFPDDANLDNVEVNQLLMRFPFPTFRNILRMEFADVPVAIFNHLLTRASNSVKILYIDSIKGTELVDVEAFNALDLDILKFDCLYETDVAFLEATSPGPGQLTRLELVCDLEFISWQRIFTVLEKWSGKVRKICVQMPSAISQENEAMVFSCLETLRLNVVNLVCIDLRIDNIATLDFLLPVKESLEHIHLEINYHATGADSISAAGKLVETQIIEIINYQNRLCESNIWRLFPNLEQIWLTWRFSLANSIITQAIETIPTWLKENTSGEASCHRTEYDERVQRNENC